MKPKWPAKLGACVDLLYTLKMKRIALDHQAEELRKQQTALSDHMLKKFDKDDLRGGYGRIAGASVDRKEVPIFEDFDKFWKYAKKNDAKDLFQRRLNVKAVEERWEAGKPIPGISKFTVVKVTPHKLGSKKRAKK